MVLVDFHITAEPDPDGFYGVGALLRSPAGTYHGVFYWMNEPLPALARMADRGIAYEIRTERIDMAVPTATGAVRLAQTREFIRPFGAAKDDDVPVTKRVAFGREEPANFRQRAIPART